MILFEDRAATVLYKVLMTLDKDKSFLLPLNICPIVPDTFLKANIKFEFVDISLETLCMDEELTLETIGNNSNIGGILFVSTFGIEIETELFYKKIKAINSEVFIIDDHCQSIQNFDFNIEDSYASLALYSSGYSKYVDIGYGGFGFLKEQEFGKIFEDKSKDKLFIDYRKLVESNIVLMRKHKVKLNTIYKEGIPKVFHLGESFENWRFSILIENKEKLLDRIFEEEGLFASSHYAAIDREYVTVTLLNSKTDEVASRIVNLFNDFRFTEEQAKKVVKVIKKFIRDTHA